MGCHPFIQQDISCGFKSQRSRVQVPQCEQDMFSWTSVTSKTKVDEYALFQPIIC